MNKTFLLKVTTLLATATLASSAFALNKQYEKMEEADQTKLTELCKTLHDKEANEAKESAAEAANAAMSEDKGEMATDKFTEDLQELKNKYPDLDFTNPCAE